MAATPELVAMKRRRENDMLFSSRVRGCAGGFGREGSLRTPQVFLELGVVGVTTAAGASAADRSTPIDSPMLLSAGSCSAMPRMLSITCVIGAFGASPP